MIPDDSRYVNADRQFVPSHSYSAQGRVDVTSEGKTAVRSKDTTYLLTTSYKALPQLSQMVQYGTDMPSLAYAALDDPTKWWVIADANPHIRHPFDMAPGDIVRLPD